MFDTVETILAIYDRPFERGKGLTDLSKGERAFRTAFGTTKVVGDFPLCGSQHTEACEPSEGGGGGSPPT